MSPYDRATEQGDPLMDMLTRTIRATQAVSLLAIVIAGFSVSAAQAESRSYVMSFLVPDMYAYGGACNALEPFPDAGFSPVGSMFRRMLIQLGYTPEEVELNKTLSEKR